VKPDDSQYIWLKHVVENKKTNILNLCVVFVWTVFASKCEDNIRKDLQDKG